MEPKSVYTARSKADASIVQGWLESEGIKARIFDGSDAAGIFDIIDSDPLVLVDAPDFDKAAEIIAQYRKELEQSPDMANVSDEEGQFDWPMCPVCDEMRLANCQQCGVSGTEFSKEQQGTTCLSCDKMTELHYADKCKFCEHDFTGATPRERATDNRRVQIAVAGLILAFAILLISFFLATR